MKRSDISDREALEACWASGQLTDRESALTVLAERYPLKVVMRKLEQLDERGLVEVGNYPWRTLEGETELERLRAESAAA